MADLSAHARRVLALARDTDEPSPGVRERVERALSARIAGGAGPLSPTLGSASVPLAAKVLLPVGIAVAVVGAGWLGLRPASERPGPASGQPPASTTPPAIAILQAPAPPPAFQSPSPDDTQATAPGTNAPRTTAPKATAPKATAPEATAPKAALDEPAPAAGSPPPRARAVDESSPLPAPESASPRAAFDGEDEPALVAAPARKPARDPLLAETDALKEAQRALRSGDTQRALELLSSQDRTFATGSLQQERAAARILALCQAGRGEQARALAARFIERWPRSALRARVTAACRAP